MSEITQLAEELVAARFEAYPFEASLLGLPGPHHRLADYREETRQRTRDHMFALARAATDVDPGPLDDTDRITRELIVQQAFALAAEIDVRVEEFSVSDGLSAPALWPLLALPLISLSDDETAEGFLARLDAMPGYLTTLSERQREGVARGLAPPAFLVRSGVGFVDRYLRARSDDPLRAIRPKRESARFAARRDALIENVVRPAYGHYRDFLAYEMLPKAREDGQAGLWWQPDGEQRYQALAAVHTTTEHSSQELHTTGLELLDKLDAEYATIGGRVFGTRSRTEIFHRIRNDPALRWSSGEELLTSARRAITRAEAVAARWFGRVPGEQVVVKPVPAAEAEGGSVAYYTPPSLDGSRPGTYFANTAEATQRCRHLSEAIAFHEAVPGHHFQITTALGLEKLPLLRRIADINAYAEGWGLYAERLADEMGLYSDDLARLGMLSQESMRAARLVVDTGLHAYGWSRQRAVSFLTEHTPMPAVEVESEVDRYAGVPAQALSYMVGRLELQRMRTQAEQALGAAFDIREFHDVVLGTGPLPMPILNTVVADWAQRKPRS